MAGFIPLIVEVGLQILSWFLGKTAQDKEMQELFYKFVEKQHDEYMNSAIMREKAKARMQAIFEKPWQETK